MVTPKESQASKDLRIAVSGTSGLVGSALVASLSGHGGVVRRLVRRPVQDSETEIECDLENDRIDQGSLADVDAVVHLAGENIASGRWTQAKKDRIRASRIEGTLRLCRALANLDTPPQVLACASAIGFYGDRGDERVDERSAAGHGFLADVCREWEAATEPARSAGIRTVNLRFGVILSPSGGALAKMLMPFKLGLGGVVGSGRQTMSWIGLDDAIAGIEFVLERESLEGPVNLVSPNPVTNREFTKTLGKVLKRPTICPMPRIAAKLAFGEMADEMLLASTRVHPQLLVDSGFSFQFPVLEDCLRRLLD